MYYTYQLLSLKKPLLKSFLYLSMQYLGKHHRSKSISGEVRGKILTISKTIKSSKIHSEQFRV